MSLKDKINADAIAAMRSKDVLKLEVLRAAKALMTNKEKELMTLLSDNLVEKTLQTMIKQRKDSAEQFTNGNRPELAKKELEEIKIIESYLPMEASEAEINHLLFYIFSKTLITDEQRNIGNVMKELKLAAERRDSRLDGKLASKLVKEALADPTQLAKYEFIGTLV